MDEVVTLLICDGENVIERDIFAPQLTYQTVCNILTLELPKFGAITQFEISCYDDDDNKITENINTSVALDQLKDTMGIVSEVIITPLVPQQFSLKLCASDSSSSAPMDSGLTISPLTPGIYSTQGVPDDFSKLEALGCGAHGTVYKNVEHDGRLVAIKVINIDMADSAGKQIERELEVLKRCHSPYIIEFISARFHENRLMLKTEYMDAGCLDRFKPVPAEFGPYVAHCVVQALRHLWSARVCHRDVKPTNMLANRLGHVKLCDFGSSKVLQASLATTYLGSDIYMSPERVRGERYSQSADLWSLGVSLVELLTGSHHLNITSSAPFALASAIVNSSPPDLSYLGIDQFFQEFVNCLLAKNPSDRPTEEQLTSLRLVNDEEAIRGRFSSFVKR